MKTILKSLGLASFLLLIPACNTGPHATRGTAVGAVGGAVVAGPAGAVVGGTVGNAYGSENDRKSH